MPATFFPCIFSSICQPLGYLPKYPFATYSCQKCCPWPGHIGKATHEYKVIPDLAAYMGLKACWARQGALLSGKTQQAPPTLSAHKGVEKQSYSENIKKTKCSNFWFPFHKLLLFKFTSRAELVGELRLCLSRHWHAAHEPTAQKGVVHPVSDRHSQSWKLHQAAFRFSHHTSTGLMYFCCGFSWGTLNKHLFTPDRALTADQGCSSSVVLFSGPGSLLSYV